MTPPVCVPSLGAAPCPVASVQSSTALSPYAFVLLTDQASRRATTIIRVPARNMLSLIIVASVLPVEICYYLLKRL